MSCNMCEDGWMCVNKCISGEASVVINEAPIKKKCNPNKARYLAKAQAKRGTNDDKASDSLKITFHG